MSDHRERAERFVTSEPWCTTECPECGVQHTDIPRLQKQEDALVAQFGEVETETLERAAKYAEAIDIYVDRRPDRLGERVRDLRLVFEVGPMEMGADIRALKEKP